MGTWPAAGEGRPDLPESVRWLPADVARQIRIHDGERERGMKLPFHAAGAVVYEMLQPGEPPDSVELEAVNAEGRRMDQVIIPPPPPPPNQPPPPPGQPPPPSPPPQQLERWRRTYGFKRGRVFEIPAATGDPWPDPCVAPLVVAIAEGPTDALALARLQLPGVLIRAGMSKENLTMATVRSLPLTTVACLVSDGQRTGRQAVAKLHRKIHAAGRPCYTTILVGLRP